MSVTSAKYYLDLLLKLLQMQIITKASSKLDSFPVLEQEKVVWQTNFRPIQKSMGGEAKCFFRNNKIRTTENCRIVQHLFWLSERQQRKILAYSQQLQSNSGSFSVVEQQQQELLLISQFTIQFCTLQDVQASFDEQEPEVYKSQVGLGHLKKQIQLLFQIQSS